MIDLATSGYVLTQMPPIDLVIPAFNEAACIDRCLDHVLAQDYPADLMRIFVVDAGSTDATAERVRARAHGEARIRLVGGGERLNAGQAMALGIRHGIGALIARVDAHTYLAPVYLRMAAELMSVHGPEVALVGGQPEQEGVTPFGAAVALARRSRFGVGSSVYSDRRAQAYVDTVQGGVYRRAAVEAVGGFSADMLVSEDEELNWRLRKAGYRVLLDTRLRFRYTTRSTWRGLFRQHRNYGRSRMRVLAAHRDFLKPRHLVPSAALVVGGGLLAVAPNSRAARRACAAAGGAYLLTAATAGLLSARDANLRLAPLVAACFPAMHAGYGEGLLEQAGAIALERLAIREARRVVSKR